MKFLKEFKSSIHGLRKNLENKYARIVMSKIYLFYVLKSLQLNKGIFK